MMWTYRVSPEALTLGTMVIVDPETKEGVRFSPSVEHARAWCKYLNASTRHNLDKYCDRMPDRITGLPVDLMTTSAEAKRKAFANMYGGGPKFGRR